MAAYVQGVHNNSSTSGTHSVATAAPVVGNILVVLTYDTGTTANSTVTDDQGGTYTRVASALKNGSADIMGIYVRDQLVANTNVHTVQSAPGATSGGGLQVYEFSGITKTGARAIRKIAGVSQVGKQENQAAATPAPALPAAALTGNPTIVAVMNASNVATLTEPTGWAERRDSGYNTPTTGFESATRNSGFTGTTATYGSASATAFCSLIVELDITVDQLATPGKLSLTLATFAPTVTATNNQRVTAGLLALTTTKYAPVIKLQVTPPVKALTLATFAPTIRLNKIATPTTKSLTTSTFAPTISAPRLVMPGTKALTTSTFAPTVSAPRLATPATKALTTTGFRPVLGLTVIVPPIPGPGPGPVIALADGPTIGWGIIIPAKALTVSTFAPTVTASDHKTATPGVQALSLTTFAPTVTIEAHGVTVTPDPASLTTTAFEPTVQLHKIATPATLPLTTTAFAPTVAAPRAVTPTTASLVLSTFAPVVTSSRLVMPITRDLTTQAFAPAVSATAHQRVVPGPLGLTLTGLAPDVDASNAIVVTPGTRQLVLTTFRPTLPESQRRPRAEKAKFRPIKRTRVVPRTADLRLTPYPPDLFILDPQETEALVMLGII